MKGVESLRNMNSIGHQQQRNFLAWVDHSRKLIHTMPGFHGTYNDKTMIRSDLFVNKVRNEPLFTDFSFEVHQADGTLTEMSGAWLLVDGTTLFIIRIVNTLSFEYGSIELRTDVLNRWFP